MSSKWGKCSRFKARIAAYWELLGLLASVVLLASGLPAGAESQASAYAGSSSCRECHERFYELWSTSHHGLAMQPTSSDFFKRALTPQTEPIEIRGYTYHADVTLSEAVVVERGPDGDKSYRIAHVMGGKNVYYFLTELERGMLQVLPVAYDVRKETWFDTAASGMRHPQAHADQPVHWRDRLYTFNTSCYGCHVSQLSTNYDASTDSYHTVWAEPGINCETCHGPSAEHVRAFRDAPKDDPPSDLRLISTNAMTKQQRNEMCAPCHAKMTPITTSFQPGNRFFDNYGLVTLEDPDFYPDGRDLGENYTYTQWLMSACVKSGQLECMHCHTSSGRYRFSDPAVANNACMPCHEQHVANPAAHTHHKNDDEGGKCISCHMPKTEFARMVRSDHSMRPPMPAATMAFGSPNACNICHTDKDAAWSNGYVREWRTRDYQAPVLKVGQLIDDARKENWTRLPEMLAYVAADENNEVFKASLVRLMGTCDHSQAWKVIIDATRDASPLVRAAAAETLDGYLVPDSIIGLLRITRDDFRLVRVRAAAALAGLQPDQLEEADRADLDKALAEFLETMNARPDDYASHYNLGNYYSDRGELDRALSSYGRAVELNSGFAPALVNASLAWSRQGRNDEAERALRKAVSLDPRSAPAYFNLGLLLAETNRLNESESSLRKTLEIDPKMPQAAHNLGVILAQQGKHEGLDWCKKAWALLPSEPKYGYTLAFYQAEMNEEDGATETLIGLLERSVPYADAYVLLGNIYERSNEKDKARSVYQRASKIPGLSAEERAKFTARMNAL